MKKPVKQEDLMGCSIACVAYVLNKSYKATKNYFKNLGNPKSTGFTCRSIVKALEKAGKNYKTKYIGKRKIKLRENSIIYIKKSKRYPYGHYLVYKRNKFMDPWINIQETKNIKEAKAGLRKKLPGKAVYCIFPII